jgi:hypothetical protein
MTSLLAARRKYFAPAYRLHAGTKPVCLGAATAPRLICTLRQSNFPLMCLRARGGPNYESSGPRHFSCKFPNYLVYLCPNHRVKKPPG